MNKIYKSIALLLMASCLSACLKSTSWHGYNFDEQKIALLKENSTTQKEVIDILGSPSLSATYGEPVYFYISSELQRVAFLDPKVSKYKVMQIAFHNGKVSKISHFQGTDLRKLKIIAERTRIKGNEVNALEQLIGNIGRFSTPKAARQ
jgi:outer membrane protein assembly factor BamE (lipoprotein component of BamABCDE complex)